MRLVTLLVGLLLTLAAAPRADVMVVDAGGTDPVLQAAVDLAADGDILLVKPGDADRGSTISLVAKGLTIVADGGPVTIGRLIVEGLPAGSQATLHGLVIGSTFAASGYETGSLEVRQCHGAVWIESCVVTSPPMSGGGWGTSYPGMAGLLVVDSAAVQVLRSRLIGGRGSIESPSCTIPGYGPPSPGGDGLRASGSVVVVHGSECTGGAGGPGVPTGGCPAGGGLGEVGGSGLLVEGSTVHVAGSALLGAELSTLYNGSSAPGSGLTVADGASIASLREVVVLAGQGPPVVPDIVAPAGTVTTYDAPARAVRVSTPVREHQAGTLTVDGQAGDLTALFTAFAGGALAVPGKQGVFSLGVPFFGPFVLGVNPSGEWTIPFQAGGLTPPSLLGQTFLLQLVVHDGTRVLFEGGTVFVLLDALIP